MKVALLALALSAGIGFAQAQTLPKATAPATTSGQTTTPPAKGGGPGQVWVNSASHVYHCPGTAYYGKTKQGKYMTEADAQKAGYRASEKN